MQVAPLQTVADLLRGQSFLDNDLFADARAFAENIMSCFGAFGQGFESLLSAVRKLTIKPMLTDFLGATRAFDGTVSQLEETCLLSQASAARCHFYCAVVGHADAARKVAAFAVSAAYAPELPRNLIRQQVTAAVGWLLVMSGKQHPPEGWTQQTAAAFLDAVAAQPGPGAAMIDRMLQSRQNLLGAGLPETSTDGTALTGASRRNDNGAFIARRWSMVLPNDTEEKRAVVVKGVGHAVSVKGLGGEADGLGLIGHPLRPAPVPDMKAVCQATG